jgi:hypothetical protein
MPATAARRIAPGSRLVIDEESGDCLQVRRSLKIWWPGLLVPLGLLLWAAGAFDWITLALQAEAPTGWPRALAALFVGAIFLAVFAFLSDEQRLTISGGRLDYTWRSGPITFRHRQAALEEVRSITCSGDEGVYYLDIMTVHWEARFGQDNSEAALLAVQGKFERLIDVVRRSQGLPPTLPAPSKPSQPAVRRQRDRKKPG